MIVVGKEIQIRVMLTMNKSKGVIPTKLNRGPREGKGREDWEVVVVGNVRGNDTNEDEEGRRRQYFVYHAPSSVGQLRA